MTNQPSFTEHRLPRDHGSIYVRDVAHDFSGSAAINFAIDYPEHTASLVILNAVLAHLIRRYHEYRLFA
jgi:hypothetical protein